MLIMNSIVLVLKKQHKCRTDDDNIFNYILPFNRQLKWKAFEGNFWQNDHRHDGTSHVKKQQPKGQLVFLSKHQKHT